jgi:5'-nucleotidase
MKLLLTNDDGIGADGLEALRAAAEGLGAVTVAAPAGGYSGCSHQVTTDGPIRVEERGPGRYAVHGTPADCARVGLHRIVPDADWVLAGINHGGNLGADVYYSGTVAAVREAVLHGWPGVALSHYRKRGMEFDWPRAARWAAAVLREILGRPPERGVFWSVNLPHLGPDEPDPPVVHCPLDPSPLPLDFVHEADELHYRGDYHGRARKPGCDVDVCFSGKIAVTTIRLL